MGDWACVQTKPQEEEKARRWITWDGHTAYLPLVRDERRPSIVRPLFKRYLFIELDERWRDILSLPGVAGILMTGERPAILRIIYRQRRHHNRLRIITGEKVIQQIKRQEGPDGIIELPRKHPRNREPFERGQRLRVRDVWHVLHGRDLIFAGMRSSQRVQVMLTWFGQDQVVDLDIRLVAIV